MKGFLVTTTSYVLMLLILPSLSMPKTLFRQTPSDITAPCDVNQSQKIDCGWDTIPKELCLETSNCCFDHTSSPICYFSNSGKLPGFKTALTQKGVGYLTSVGLEYIQSTIGSTTIPSVAGEKDSIDWKVEDLVVSELLIGSVGISVSDSIPGFVIIAQEVSARLTGHWKGEEHLWPHEPKASGDADVHFSDSSIQLNVGIRVDEKGQLQTFSGGVFVNLNHLDMHFSGSNLDWIIKLLQDIFPHEIHDKVSQSLEGSFSYLLDNDLNTIIATVPTQLDLTSHIGVDYSLVSEVVMKDQFFSFPSFGDVFDVTHHKHEYRGDPIPLPNFDKTFNNRDLQIFVSEVVPNSAGYVLWREGLLQITADNSDVPSYSPINLNTSDWKTLVPNLYKLYPNWDMTVTLSASSPPRTIFVTEGANVTANVTIQMNVISPTNGTTIPAFVLSMSALASGEASIVKGKIVPKLSYLTSSVQLKESYIGKFDADVVTSLVVFLAEDVFVPWANANLAVGLPIPTADKMSVSDAKLYYSNGLLIGATNIKYK